MASVIMVSSANEVGSDMNRQLAAEAINVFENWTIFLDSFGSLTYGYYVIWNPGFNLFLERMKAQRDKIDTPLEHPELTRLSRSKNLSRGRDRLNIVDRGPFGISEFARSIDIPAEKLIRPGVFFRIDRALFADWTSSPSKGYGMDKYYSTREYDY